MRINNNIMALNAHRQLGINQGGAAKSMEKLSSGFRINRAGDDAAGLAISEKMRGQIRGLKQASRNAQDGISLIQTAEGALNETHSILQRMRELANQAANDTNVKVDRDEIQKEINQLTSEISRIGNTTEFNTQKVINGDMQGAGADAKMHTVKLDFAGQFDGTEAGVVKLDIGGKTLTINLNESANSGSDGMAVDASTSTVTVGISDAQDEIANDLVSVLNNLKGQAPNSIFAEFDYTADGEKLVITAKSDGVFAGATGVDSVKLTSGMMAEQLEVTQAGEDGSTGEATLQVGANNGQQFKVSISDMRSLALKISSTSAGAAAHVLGAIFTDAADAQLTDISADGSPEYGLDVSDATKATAAIEVINDAIETVSAERSRLGAYQNRLEHTISNLGTSAENLQAAESRIRDLDMADEIMKFTKDNILQQAATAMLAQANMAPQSVLQLLG
jgi:flagellin